MPDPSVSRPWCTTDENYEVGYVEFTDGARNAEEAVKAFLAWYADDQAVRFEDPDQVTVTSLGWWHMDEESEEFCIGRGADELQMWTIDFSTAGCDIA